jgi:hypothetical protein
MWLMIIGGAGIIPADTQAQTTKTVLISIRFWPLRLLYATSSYLALFLTHLPEVRKWQRAASINAQQLMRGSQSTFNSALP